MTDQTVAAADAGATEERTPKPNDATATSATRLKFVFVDIIFLSIVANETFSLAALKCAVRTNASLSPRTIRSTEETLFIAEAIMKWLPCLRWLSQR